MSLKVLISQAGAGSALIVLILLGVWETIFPYFKQFKKKRSERWVHASRNLLIGAFNGIAVSLLFSVMWLTASELSFRGGWGLLHQLHLSPVIHASLAVLVMDFWTYWWHRINHEVPFFWRFHVVHHSDRDMDVTTAYRFHLGEITLSSLIRVPILFIVGISLWQLTLYELVLFVCVQFHHANIGISERMDRVFRWVFTSPYMHKVHHSNAARDFNSNYTSLFSIWDRLFGTYRMAQKPEALVFGFDPLNGDAHQTIVGMMKTPMRGFSTKGED